MKRILILSLAAGMLSIGTPALLAQVSTNSTGQSATQQPDPQQRQQDRRRLYKILELNPKDLKGLSPEERRAKVKDATDQKISQLEQKKTAGTITPEEQSDLTFLESHQKHGKKKAASDS
jgi:hypothetical protein